MLKKLILAGLVISALAGVAPSMSANAVQAGKNDPDTIDGAKKCDNPAYGTNKVDVNGSHKTITITATPGYLIDAYCVKAGSSKQGNGAVYTLVNPAVAQITISHPSGKDISHYTYHETKIVTPPTDDPKNPPVDEPKTPQTDDQGDVLGTTTLPAELPYTGGSNPLATTIILSAIGAVTAAVSMVVRRVLTR